MDLHLKDKCVVITGGGTGIGKETAKAFLEEGAKVTILGRREAPLKEFQDEAKSQGYEIDYYTCDVTNLERVKEVASNVFKKYGRIDVWVNNAGISKDKPFLDFTEEDYDSVMNIDLKAVFDCTRVAAEYMKETGGGVIINASSFASKIPHANGVIYGAAKAGVSNLTKSTAAALAPYGIRVVGYIPGMIVTPISEQIISNYKQKFIKDISLGRLGHPDDLAKPIVFLASDAAKYISGVDLEISGGKFAVQDCDMAWRFMRGEEK